jgi:hypothetical protein
VLDVPEEPVELFGRHLVCAAANGQRVQSRR